MELRPLSKRRNPDQRGGGEMMPLPRARRQQLRSTGPGRSFEGRTLGTALPGASGARQPVRAQQWRRLDVHRAFSDRFSCRSGGPFRCSEFLR